MKVTPLTNKVTSLTQKAAPSSTSNAVKLLEKTKIAIDKTKSKSKVQFDSAQSSTTMAEQHELTGIKQSAASIASNKKVGPNFNKMHQKQFNNSKPITSLVERVSYTSFLNSQFSFEQSSVDRTKTSPRKWMKHLRQLPMEFLKKL
jgi:hypothetical protein